MLGVCGSLRADSWNQTLIRAAIDLAPAHVRISLWPLHEIPLFNADFEASRPEAVDDWIAVISQADALLVSTPEYNGSIPGVLKNALDWASRPPLFNPLRGKPVAVVGASTGYGGTRRAQNDLRRVLDVIGACLFPHPLVALELAGSKFSERTLLDDDVRQALAETVVTLAAQVQERRAQ